MIDADILKKGNKRTSDALRILRHIESVGEATSDECTIALNITHQSCSPRFKELYDAGCIKKTGKTRVTSNGGTAHVYAFVNGDFSKYVNRRKCKPTERNELIDRDDAIIKECNKFITLWYQVPSPKQRGIIVTKLVKNLLQIDRK